MVKPWPCWGAKDVLSAIDRKSWRTFREVQRILAPGHLQWVGSAFMKAAIRQLVTEGRVAERMRDMTGVRRGRGPDEFRRVR